LEEIKETLKEKYIWARMRQIKLKPF